MLRLFTNQQGVIDSGAPYFRLVCLSYLPMGIAGALCGMLRAVEVVRITLYAVLVAVITNIFFNWMFIFGRLGAPELGARGAALGTVIARICECTIVLIYAFRVQTRVPLKLREIWRAPGYLWRDFAKFGLPVAVGDAQWALVGAFKGMIIGRLSQEMIAANGVAENFMTMGMTFTGALSVGACVAIGKTVGEKDYDRTREYSVKIQRMFVCVGVFMAAVVFLARGLFVSIMQVSADTQALAMQLIAIGAVTLIGTTYHASCFVGINRGAGDGKFVFWVDLICGWLVVLPLTWLCAFVAKLPMPLIFLSLRIDQCFKWIIAFFRLRGDKWIRNVTRE